MTAARYVWAHPFGPTALLTIAASLILLAAQALPVGIGWPPFLLLAAVPRMVPASYQARHRRLACRKHRMVRGKARR